MIQFLAIALVLPLVWGFLIQKSDSLWGAVLLHAAGDCLIMVPIFLMRTLNIEHPQVVGLVWMAFMYWIANYLLVKYR